MSDDHKTDANENNPVVAGDVSHNESWSRLKDSYDPKTISEA